MYFVLFFLVFVLYLCIVLFFYFFFFKQKTAYEMRISDWSSDVCSSDLSPSAVQGCLRSIDERAHVRSIPWSPAHEGLVCQSRPTWPFPDRCVADYGRPRAGRAWPDCGPSADQDSHPARFQASGAVDHAVGRVARQSRQRHAVPTLLPSRLRVDRRAWKASVPT